MADLHRGLTLARGLSQAGMQDQGPSAGLAGMLSRMPPEQLEMWRKMMLRQQMEMMGQQPQGGISMGMPSPLPPQIAPYAQLLGQNRGLAQILQRFGQ